MFVFYLFMIAFKAQGAQGPGARGQGAHGQKHLGNLIDFCCKVLRVFNVFQLFLEYLQKKLENIKQIRISALQNAVLLNVFNTFS